MKYLYVTEDGVLQSNGEPTADEKEEIDAGRLHVFKFEDGQFYGAEVTEILDENNDCEPTGDYELDWSPV